MANIPTLCVAHRHPAFLMSGSAEASYVQLALLTMKLHTGLICGAQSCTKLHKAAQCCTKLHKSVHSCTKLHKMLHFSSKSCSEEILIV